MARKFIDPASPLHEYGTWFESFLLSGNRSTQTRDVYLGAVEQLDRFLAEQGMPRELQKIKRTHVEAFIRDQLTRLKPASAAARYSGLRSFFAWAVREGEITDSPMEKMSPPKVPDTPIKSLSDAEVERLLRSCEGVTFRQRRDAAILRLMLDTGMRRSECAHLKVTDLNQEQRLAKIEKGKGNKTRVVGYSFATAQALFRYLNLRKKHSKAASEYLWLGQVGPMSPDAIAEVVARRSRKAEVFDHDGTPLHAHQLRHSWADHNLRAGMSEGDLMQLGGWANSDIMRRYGRDQAQSRALEAQRRLFGEERATA